MAKLSVCGEGAHGNSVVSTLYFYEPYSALKNEVY